MGFPFGPAVRLLALTGARRQEIFDLTWPEVDLEGAVIRLPAARAKTSEARNIPLPPMAITILEAAPRFANSDLVFTLSGQAPYSNFSQAKARLDRAIG